MNLSSVYLYRCSGYPEYEQEDIADYLSKIYPKSKIEQRDEFFSYLKKEPSLDIDNLAEEITLCRVHKVNEEVSSFSPLPAEIDYEKKKLQGKQLKGVIYDGFRLQRVCKQLINPHELILSTCHLIFTNQLIASFDQADKRYHLRVGIYGSPNIISTIGLIEALAKPREYYLKKQMGMEGLNLEQEFKGQTISYDDSRITEILKGYACQALFYQIQGEAFCEDKNCRLYNAHWQKDALIAQIEGEYEFCPRHTEVISGWQNR